MTPSPLRFLFITCGYPPDKAAGAERGLERLSNALVARSHSVTILTIHHDATLPAQETTDSGVVIHRALKPMALGPLWGITLRRQVKAFLKDHLSQYDVVICNQLFLYSDIATKMATEQKIPSGHLIVNAHEFSDFSVLKKERGGQKILDSVKDSSSVFVLSRKSKREAESLGFQQNQILPYRYFTDPSTGTKPCRDSRSLLFIGRLSEQKCVPALLKSFLKYCDDHSKLNLIIIGDGDKKEELLQLLRATNHSSRVTLYPWTSEPEQMFRKVRAVVSTTQAEGLSNVMIESLAHGRPILWTDVSGVRDALDDDQTLPDQITPGTCMRGKGGLLIPTHDEQATIEGLIALENDDLVEQMSGEALEQFQKLFTEDQCVELFLQSVQQLFSQQRDQS